MIIPIVISVAVVLLVIGFGATIWFILRRGRAIKAKESVQQTTGTALAFHWSYIILPVMSLLLSLVLTACFYSRLPAEVVYRLQSDGSPDGWLGRGALLLWMLLPQLLLTLLAGAITWGVTRLGVLFGQPESTWVKPERVLLLMGNMVALPQIILCFAMLHIFIYNSYQVQILPVWAFALIMMGLGVVVLGVFFSRVMWRLWGANR